MSRLKVSKQQIIPSNYAWFDRYCSKVAKKTETGEKWTLSLESEDKRLSSTRGSTFLAQIDKSKNTYSEIKRITLIIVWIVLPPVFHARKTTLSYRMKEKGQKKSFATERNLILIDKSSSSVWSEQSMSRCCNKRATACALS